MELKTSTSEELYEKYSFRAREVEQACLLQANLYNDLMELGQKFNFIKTSFVGASELKLQVFMKDSTSIEGPTSYMKYLDPKLIYLNIVLPDDLERTHFTRFATAIGNLSNKIGDVNIQNISPFDRHVNDLCRIFNKTDKTLELRYNKEVEYGDMEVIKNQLQLHIDHMEETKTILRLLHRGRSHLMRHSSYTSMTSSVIKPSHFRHGSLTINLNGIVDDKIFEQVESTRKQCFWDFVISHEKEVKKLIEVLMKVESLLISNIHIYIPTDINWNYIRMFRRTINKMEHKVNQINLFNLIRSEIGCDEISLLMTNVENYLGLLYTEDITEDEITQWGNKLQLFVHLMSPNLDLRIHFGNLMISRLPHTRLLEISTVASL